MTWFIWPVRILGGLALMLPAVYMFGYPWLISPLPDRMRQPLNELMDMLLAETLSKWLSPDDWFYSIAIVAAMAVLGLCLILGWQFAGKLLATAVTSAYVALIFFAAAAAVNWGFGDELPAIVMFIFGPLGIPSAAPVNWPGWLAGLAAAGAFLVVFVSPILLSLAVATPVSIVWNTAGWLTKRLRGSKQRPEPSSPTPAKYWRGRRIE